VAIQVLFHQPAGFELHYLPGRNVDSSQRSGILCCSWRALAWFKNAEVTKLQTVAFGKFADDFVQKALESISDQRALGLSAFGNSVDQVFFCDC